MTEVTPEDEQLAKLASIAITSPNEGRLRRLLDSASSDEVRRRAATTCLVHAAACGTKAIIEILVTAGGDVNRPIGSHTALMIASGAWIYTAFGGASAQGMRMGGLELVEGILAAGARVNEKNRSDGATALHYAVLAGRVDSVKVLLAAGADVDAIMELFMVGPCSPFLIALQGDSIPSGRLIPALLRGGTTIPYGSLMNVNQSTYGSRFLPFVKDVLFAGGYEAYERHRCQRLAAILCVYFGDRLPGDALLEVAEFSAYGLITASSLARASATPQGPD